MKSLLKGKNSTLYIIIGVLVVVLLGFLVWTFYFKKDPSSGLNLEQESELIRQELANMRNQDTSPPKEGYNPPQQQPPKAKPSLVLFHNTHCGPCQQMMGAWQQAKQQIGGNVTVMEFEASTEPGPFQQANVSGTPTIRFYPDGFPSQRYAEYGGNRQTDSLVRFALSGGSQS